MNLVQFMGRIESIHHQSNMPFPPDHPALLGEYLGEFIKNHVDIAVVVDIYINCNGGEKSGSKFNIRAWFSLGFCGAQWINGN